MFYHTYLSWKKPLCKQICQCWLLHWTKSLTRFLSSSYKWPTRIWFFNFDFVLWLGTLDTTLRLNSLGVKIITQPKITFIFPRPLCLFVLNSSWFLCTHHPFTSQNKILLSLIEDMIKFLYNYYKSALLLHKESN